MQSWANVSLSGWLKWAGPEGNPGGAKALLASSWPLCYCPFTLLYSALELCQR